MSEEKREQERETKTTLYYCLTYPFNDGEEAVGSAMLF